MTFATVVSNLITIVNSGLIPLLFALAVIYFIINIVRFFFIQGGEEGIQKGQQSILYGLIGLFVIFSIWGIVNILLNTLNAII
jgi:heme/copper-type cytochrome/quinol oxidase subunit 4